MPQDFFEKLLLLTTPEKNYYLLSHLLKVQKFSSLIIPLNGNITIIKFIGETICQLKKIFVIVSEHLAYDASLEKKSCTMDTMLWKVLVLLSALMSLIAFIVGIVVEVNILLIFH